MDAKTQKLYDRWEDGRTPNRLGKGQRWLTPDDVWQEGDEYMASMNGEWWAIGGPHTSVPGGTSVDTGFLCYTPRGSIKRA